MSESQTIWERGHLDDQYLGRVDRIRVVQMLREHGLAVEVIRVGTGDAVSIKMSPTIRVITATGMRPSWRTFEVQRYTRADGWDMIQPETTGRGELMIMRADPVEICAAWRGFLAGLRAGMTTKASRSVETETRTSK